MLSTALIVVVGLLVVGACIVGLSSTMQRRIDRETRALDAGDRERADATHRIAADMDRARYGGFGGFFGT